MHSTPLLEEFRTGRKGPVTHTICNRIGPDGKLVFFTVEGDEYKVGMGDGIVKLLELHAERKRRSTWWYRFLNGRFSCLELDVSIKRLTEILNYSHYNWVE